MRLTTKARAENSALPICLGPWCLNSLLAQESISVQRSCRACMPNVRAVELLVRSNKQIQMLQSDWTAKILQLEQKRVYACYPTLRFFARVGLRPTSSHARYAHPCMSDQQRRRRGRDTARLKHISGCQVDRGEGGRGKATAAQQNERLAAESRESTLQQCRQTLDEQKF